MYSFILWKFGKLFGGWMRSRANVGDASKGRSSDPCKHHGLISVELPGEGRRLLIEIHKGAAPRLRGQLGIDDPAL